MHKAVFVVVQYLSVCVCLSVCLSVCPSRAGIVPKRCEIQP